MSDRSKPTSIAGMRGAHVAAQPGQVVQRRGDGRVRGQAAARLVQHLGAAVQVQQRQQRLARGGGAAGG